MNFLKYTALFAAVLFAGCAPSVHQNATTPKPTVMLNQSSGLSIVTWNVEHLAFPQTLGCKPRGDAELNALSEYAESLDADIVALQEVSSIDAVKQIFPEQEWQFVISGRPNSEPYVCRESGFTSTQQKVAFAVKKGIDIKQVEDFSDLALNMPGLRYGLSIKVDSPYGLVNILNVHMKSGCYVDDYLTSDKEACEVIAEQVPVLSDWIGKQEKAGLPYVILGDFNHRISAPYNRFTRNILNDKRSTTIATSHLIGCHRRYPAPIDHIIVGGMPTEGVIASAAVHPYKNMRVADMLSDHCAISARLFTGELPLSSAVRWQTTSKEYKALVEQSYQSAASALMNMTEESTENPQKNWVVVMDVDETILDNTQYQVQIEKQGMSYSPETWAEWVRSEQATLVPGVKSFIKTVFERGGKLALVTNRNKQLDANTWNNLRALGLDVTAQNTCLIGRSKADKSAVGKSGIHNDKDLRRQQVQEGTADCFTTEQQRHSSWQAPHTIVMQIGDNIEDFAGVTQEDVQVNQVLPQLGKSLILLPNPMYGSW